MRDRAGAATLSRGAAPYTSLREWRALAVAGKTPTDVVLRKAYTCEKIVTVDATARQKQFVISTASVDREGDTVAPEGWVLDDYQANPVVLWAHDGEQPPIGQTVRMGVDGSRKLLSVVQFAPREVYEFADTIYQLVDGGYIRAASVGFLPIEFQFDSHREGSGFAPPCNFTKQALLEWSVCPVPANPAPCALRRRRAGAPAGLGRAHPRRGARRARRLDQPRRGDGRPQAAGHHRPLAPVVRHATRRRGVHPDRPHAAGRRRGGRRPGRRAAGACRCRARRSRRRAARSPRRRYR
jgi:hypothetical protein